MIYSRFLYTEYEQPHNADGEGAYTIFSTQQFIDYDLFSLDEFCIQYFAVLWEGLYDTRIIEIIERAITLEALTPVKLLHASKGVLTVVYDRKLPHESFLDFEETWLDLAGSALYEEWNLILIREGSLLCNFYSGEIFFKYANDILMSHTLGLQGYSIDLFLFAKDWTPEAVFGADYKDKLPLQRSLWGDNDDYFF